MVLSAQYLRSQKELSELYSILDFGFHWADINEMSLYSKTKNRHLDKYPLILSKSLATTTASAAKTSFGKRVPAVSNLITIAIAQFYKICFMLENSCGSSCSNGG